MWGSYELQDGNMLLAGDLVQLETAIGVSMLAKSSKKSIGILSLVLDIIVSKTEPGKSHKPFVK